MKISDVRFGSALVCMTVVGCAVSVALPPDPHLLSLVPSDSQIVAGAVAPMGDPRRGNFLVFTRANTLDVADFFALMGGDPALDIQQMIFAASAEPSGAAPEHSLLVVGRFDAKRLYRFANTLSTSMKYHGVDLIVVHPFERERAILRDDRLLAIVNSRIAIFGTALSVEEEIDRYLGGAAADALIMQKLSQLRNQDEVWCLISSLSLEAQIPRVLRNLDPAFAEIDENSDTFLFGIKFGRQIDFEYVINRHPVRKADPVSSRPAERMFKTSGRSLSLTSDSLAVPGNRRVVKISKMRYQQWLATMTQH